MDKRVIEGIVEVDNQYGSWIFATDNEIFSEEIPATIDSILGTDSQVGDRFRITIERL